MMISVWTNPTAIFTLIGARTTEQSQVKHELSFCARVRLGNIRRIFFIKKSRILECLIETTHFATGAPVSACVVLLSNGDIFLNQKSGLSCYVMLLSILSKDRVVQKDKPVGVLPTKSTYTPEITKTMT